MGATNEEVINAVGHPTWVVVKDDKTYYIYQWTSGEAGIIMALRGGPISLITWIRF